MTLRPPERHAVVDHQQGERDEREHDHGCGRARADRGRAASRPARHGGGWMVEPAAGKFGLASRAGLARAKFRFGETENLRVTNRVEELRWPRSP
jgi:hypothetical protein